MANITDNLNISYTYHLHSGNETNGDGCYTTPVYYYSYTAYTYCNHPNLAYAEVGDGDDFYRCYDCGTTSINKKPSPKVTGSYTAYEEGYTIPSGATLISTTYEIWCGKTEDTIESATITY